jgi:hypothetical protein
MLVKDSLSQLILARVSSPIKRMRGVLMSDVSLSKIENMIYIIRGQKVMLDSDLAELYQVETKALNQAVKRNQARFPKDFMFQLTQNEYRFLKSQIVTSKIGSGGKQKIPFVFTENGLAMLSGVLKSERAILVNIAIMRIFTRLRSFLFLEQELRKEMNNLKTGSSTLFKVVFERLDALDVIVDTKLPTTKKRIGLNK